MTAQLSRERLEEIVKAAGLEPCDADEVFDSIKCWELVKMASMLLAGMDSEPVAWQYRVSAGPATGWSLWHEGKGEQYEKSYHVERRALYSAPPAPVAVPDIATPKSMRTMFCLLDDSECAIAADVWNACRAAMLKVWPVTGWIKCSERMPEQKQSNRYIGLNLLLNERTVVQGGFDGGSFWLDGEKIDNVTRWMPLPAAPEQEV